MYMFISKILKSKSGFSLLEILVATAIASIILLISGRTYHAVFRIVGDLTGHVEFYENINLTLNRMDRDISNTFYINGNKKIPFISESDGRSGKINFITTDHRDLNISGIFNKSNPVSDIYEVGYYLKDDIKYPGLFFLIRREQLHYDKDTETGGKENVLLKNVTSLSFEFKVNNSWVIKWDSRENDIFPQEVRITLKAKNFSGKEETFQMYSILNMMVK